MNLDQLENSTTNEERELDSLPDLEDGVYYDVDNNTTTTNTTDTENQDEENITEPEERENEENINNDSSEPEEETNIEIENTQSENANKIDTSPTSNEAPILIDLGDTKIEINSQEELKKLAESSVKDKAKFDKYKEDISIVEGLKEQGVEEEDLYLLAEAKKGNPKAIAKLLKKANIDPMDIDVDDDEITEYKPNEVKADMEYIEAKSILENIQKDPQVSTKFDNLVMREFDEKSRQTVFKDSNNLKFVAELTKSGLIDNVLPEYTKMKLLGEPGSQFDLLVKAYDKFISNLKETTEQKAQDTKTEIETKTKSKSEKRKRMSAGSKTKNTPTKKEKSVDEMTDAEFEAYYNNLVGVNGFVVD